jgi:hypothetical protein
LRVSTAFQGMSPCAWDLGLSRTALRPPHGGKYCGYDYRHEVEQKTRLLGAYADVTPSRRRERLPHARTHK